MARIFRGTGAAKLTAAQKAWIADGGILFYSVEPTNWSAWGDWHAAWKIKRVADAIKAVAPAQVMLAPGYEADGHAAEAHPVFKGARAHSCRKRC